MSASLVGSEMCIRDSRCTSNPEGLAQRPLYLLEVGGVNLRRGRVRLVENCLLYTSDAADDM
eukprot:3953472-Alexandrium_andersonii.AAC.1